MDRLTLSSCPLQTKSPLTPNNKVTNLPITLSCSAQIVYGRYICQQFCSASEQAERLSLDPTFTPQVDSDWSANTTEQELVLLYDQTSLLAETGLGRKPDARARPRFAGYQQINLMFFTAMLERHRAGRFGPDV